MIEEINECTLREIVIMEVCGTHTQAISKFGIRSLINKNIRLVSGPGCPVCVTDEKFIDDAIFLLERGDIILASFGDVMRLYGTNVNSLSDEKSKGRDIRIIYSPMETIKLAKEYPYKNIVFLGVGFETTAPLIGLVVQTAKDMNINNLFILTSLKIMEPILRLILEDKNRRIDGLICPGHVAAVKGAQYFSFIQKEYGIPSAVCGFEELDIVSGIYTILQQYAGKADRKFYNLYKRCVRDKGNPIARTILNEVFSVGDAMWRGIGFVPQSSLVLDERYEDFDAARVFGIERTNNYYKNKCQCREILLGYKKPSECDLFGKECKPQNPVGACMVSEEGSCSIEYKYGKG